MKTLTEVEVWEMESKISDIMIYIDVPLRLKGFRFMIDAILFCIQEPNHIESISSKLYPIIAEKYETTTICVERAIRQTIGAAWKKSHFEKLETLFGYSLHLKERRPTSSEFIALMSELIRLTFKNE